MDRARLCSRASRQGSRQPRVHAVLDMSTVVPRTLAGVYGDEGL